MLDKAIWNHYNYFRLILKEERLMTKYEKEIYSIVSQSDQHMTADQVLKTLRKIYPSVSTATVYNNLNKLCEAGMLRRISSNGSPDRYDRSLKHDHMVCSQCGKLTDVCFEDLTPSLKKQLGEDFLFYDLKVYSLCAECRKKAEKMQGI